MAAFALIAWSAAAQEMAPDPGPRSEAASLRMAAERLAAHGRAQGDPVILLGAAEALLAGGAQPAPDDPWQVAALLSEAEALGGADLRGLIADLRHGAARGIVDGPIRSELTLAPGESDRLEIIVAGGELADVEVRLKAGAGAADLDLVVRDETGAMVTGEQGPDTGRLGHAAYAAWVPERCGRYAVEISNAGSERAAFVLLMSRSRRYTC